AVTRLQDMGCEPYLVCSALIGVLAQRLVRRICEASRVQARHDPDDLRGLAGPCGGGGTATPAAARATADAPASTNCSGSPRTRASSCSPRRPRAPSPDTRWGRAASPSALSGGGMWA